MRPAQAKEKALAFVDAHFSGDVETALSLCSPDYESVVFAPIDLFPHLGQKQGLDGLRESLRVQDERFCERKYDILNAIGDENEAAIVVSARKKKRNDARVVQFVAAHIFVFRGDLIWRHRELFDTFNVVEQLLGKDLTPEFTGAVAKAMKGTPAS